MGRQRDDRRGRRRGRTLLAVVAGLALATVMWREMPAMKRYMKIRKM